jgi:hypothetical protein
METAAIDTTSLLTVIPPDVLSGSSLDPHIVSVSKSFGMRTTDLFSHRPVVGQGVPQDLTTDRHVPGRMEDLLREQAPVGEPRGVVNPHQVQDPMRPLIKRSLHISDHDLITG